MWRTPACSPATAPSSTTSPAPACCTPASCAVPSPGHASTASTPRPRWNCRVSARSSPRPTSIPTSRRPGTQSRARMSQTLHARRWPKARRSLSATPSRSSSPTAATSPRTRSSWWRSTTNRCLPSRTSPKRSGVLPPVRRSCTTPTPTTSRAEWAGRRRTRRPSRPRPTSPMRTSINRSMRRCRSRRAVWSRSGRRPRPS